MAPLRGHRSHSKNINEADILRYARTAGAFSVVVLMLYESLHFTGPHIGPYYSQYSDDLRPLSNFTSVPEDLIAVSQTNGDIAL